jgi:hypothetical protein
VTRRVLSVLFLTLAAICPAISEDPTFSLEGNVQSATTGEPLRRAAVMLLSPNLNLSVTADAGGHFLFPNLPAGNYALNADKSGFARSNPQSISVGPSHQDLVLKLVPFSRITGKVLDENGDPMLSAQIQIFRSVIQSGRRTLLPASNALTNDLGEYHVSSLPPGRYFAGATAPPDPDGGAFARVYYGGSSDLGSAAPIELTPGSTVQANITLRPTSSFSVRGAITGLPENTHPYLNLFRKGSPTAVAEGHATQIDPTTGEFEFSRVTPGAWVINAGCFDRNVQVSGSADVVVSDRDAEGIVVALSKMAEVTGHVTYEQAATPVPGRQPTVNVMLRPAAGGMTPSLGSRMNMDGTMSFSGMAPGEYILTVRAPAPLYVKSVLMGGQNIAGVPFPVTQSGGPAPFEVVVGTGGAQLDGAVLEGSAPATGAFVLLLASNGSGDERTARSDSTGHVSFTALGPGEYTAYAFSDLESIEYMNPDVMKNFSGTGVTLTEGAKQQVELKLNRTVY